MCSRGITIYAWIYPGHFNIMETNIYEIKSSDLLQFEIRRPEYEFKSGPLFFVANKYLP